MKFTNLLLIFTAINSSPTVKFKGPAGLGHVLEDTGKEIANLPSKLALGEVALDPVRPKKRIAGFKEIAAVLGGTAFLTSFGAVASDEWNAKTNNAPRIL